MVERIGYVGLNHSHRRRYVESLRELSREVEVVAACEPDEEFDLGRVDELDLAALEFYRDPAELVTCEDLDVVWVSLPNRTTPPVIEAAADGGVDVFAEKSLARTAADLEPVLEAVRDAGVTVGTGYLKRAQPVYRELRKRRIDGFFGDLRAFDGRFIKNKLAARLRSDAQPDFLYTRADARGGIVQWLGCHYLDLFEWVLGEPIVELNARLSRGVDAVDTEDGALLQLETESGAHGSLQVGYYLRDGPDPTGDTHVGPAYEPFQLYGMDGAAVVGPDEESLRLGADTAAWASGPTRTLAVDPPAVEAYGGQAGLDYFEAFFEVREGRENDLVATIGDEHRILRLLDAVYESADTGRWVTVEPRE